MPTPETPSKPKIPVKLSYLPPPPMLLLNEPSTAATSNIQPV
jgi:hypothetical protein